MVMNPPTFLLSGVPQGSVLGPLLFIIYVDGVSSVISDKASAILYADDMTLYRPIYTPHDYELLQRDINAISRWISDPMFKNASTWSSQGNTVLYLLSVACLLMIFPLKRSMFTSILGFILHQIYAGLFTLTKSVPNQKSLSVCSTADSSQVWILKVADFCINHISDLI